MKNDGKSYEQFVALLQQALLDAESYTGQKNIEVQLNKKIVDNAGIKREFDLYWEYELAGITYKTVIECKDYNSSVKLEKIDALIGKIRDLPDLRAVFATTKGYQSGAKTKAQQNRVDLLIVREQNDSDWHSADGTPYIKIVDIQLKICMPAVITQFRPLIDGAWAKEHLGADISSVIAGPLPTNEVLIENHDNGESYSLHELERGLSSLDTQEFGSFSKKVLFDQGWIIGPDFKYKIKGFDFAYTISPPHDEPISIDFSKELLGVIEYLEKGTKKSVFKKGLIKESTLLQNR